MSDPVQVREASARARRPGSDVSEPQEAEAEGEGGVRTARHGEHGRHVIDEAAAPSLRATVRIRMLVTLDWGHAYWVGRAVRAFTDGDISIRRNVARVRALRLLAREVSRWLDDPVAVEDLKQAFSAIRLVLRRQASHTAAAALFDLAGK